MKENSIETLSILHKSNQQKTYFYSWNALLLLYNTFHNSKWLWWLIWRSNPRMKFICLCDMYQHAYVLYTIKYQHSFSQKNIPYLYFHPWGHTDIYTSISYGKEGSQINMGSILHQRDISRHQRNKTGWWQLVRKGYVCGILDKVKIYFQMAWSKWLRIYSYFKTHLFQTHVKAENKLFWNTFLCKVK